MVLTDGSKMKETIPRPISVCVFCASSDHVPETYSEAARDLGREMAARGIRLVYGGGNNGLMGVLAEEMHRLGGTITGVIPLALKDMGYAFDRADEIVVTDGLRERKAIMEERADGFIGLPGGFGTIEEMLEIITLRQLGLHGKPIVFLDIGGFFGNLLAQFERGYREQFIPEECRALYSVTDSVTEALDAIEREAGDEIRRKG
jgi:cytokinin riboside 5'-monophosphate phosphoribohydrolase